MKSRTLIGLSAIFWAIFATIAENGTMLAVVIAGHALFWQGHNIEVKLNKLLDYHRLTVTGKDLD